MAVPWAASEEHTGMEKGFHRILRKLQSGWARQPKRTKAAEWMGKAAEKNIDWARAELTEIIAKNN